MLVPYATDIAVKLAITCGIIRMPKPRSTLCLVTTRLRSPKRSGIPHPSLCCPEPTMTPRMHQLMHHPQVPSRSIKPAFNRTNGIFDANSYTATGGIRKQQLVYLKVVALDRLFSSPFNPEHRSILLSMFSHVVGCQLRFARRT